MKGGLSVEKILAFLEKGQADKLAPLLQRRKLDSGEVLFSTGEEGDEVFFVADGEVAVKKYTGFEGKMQVVALLGDGALVGEGSFFKGTERTATVVATRPTQLFVFSRQDYKKFRQEDADGAISFCEHCVHISGIRLAACGERLAHIL